MMTKGARVFCRMIGEAVVEKSLGWRIIVNGEPLGPEVMPGDDGSGLAWMQRFVRSLGVIPERDSLGYVWEDADEPIRILAKASLAALGWDVDQPARAVCFLNCDERETGWQRAGRV